MAELQTSQVREHPRGRRKRPPGKAGAIEVKLRWQWHSQVQLGNEAKRRMASGKAGGEIARRENEARLYTRASRNVTRTAARVFSISIWMFEFMGFLQPRTGDGRNVGKSASTILVISMLAWKRRSLKFSARRTRRRTQTVECVRSRLVGRHHLPAEMENVSPVVTAELVSARRT